MILPLNRAVVVSEVLRWAQYQVARVLGCPLADVDMKIETGEKGMQVAFSAPGIDGETVQEAMALIHYQTKLMARERLEGLTTRRAR